jgi:hypothetical protein
MGTVIKHLEEMANKHMQPDLAITSLFHAECPSRKAADVQRYA